MKKIIALAVLVLIIAGLAFNYSRILSFFEKKDENVVAKVNGVEISLDEVEALYDMYYIHLKSNSHTVESVQMEYARIIQNRIKQILISQELMKRKAQVTDEEVNAFENEIRSSYGLSDNQEVFAKEIVENYGINYNIWKNQLRLQLEEEKLQKLLMKEITINSEETMQYAERIQDENKKKFGKIDFFKIDADPSLLKEIIEDKTFTAETLKDAPFDENAFINTYEKKGANVYQSLFDGDSLPEEYQKILDTMQEKTFSQIITKDKDNYVLFLVKKEQSKKNDDAVDLYLLAEEKLVQDKLPEYYQNWLEQTIKKAQIFIADSFNIQVVPVDKKINNIQELQESLKEIAE